MTQQLRAVAPLVKDSRLFPSTIELLTTTCTPVPRGSDVFFNLPGTSHTHDTHTYRQNTQNIK